MSQTDAGAARPVDDLASRLPKAILIAVLCLLLAARMADAVGHSGPGYLPFVVALFMLPLLYAIPGTRPLWTRHRFWLLAAQAVLTYLPFALFGDGWVGGMSGLLGGLLLLTVAAPAVWLLFGALMVLEGVLWIGVVGLPFAPAPSAAVWVLVAAMVNALALFGLGRLADVVREIRAAERELAGLAVARERLRVAQDLRSTIGERLAAVATRGDLALRVVSRSPAQARQQITEVGGVARQALADARAVTVDYRSPAHPADAELRQTGAVLAPRVAQTVLVLVLGAFAVQYLNNIFLRDPAVDAEVAAAAVADTAAVVAVQLHHSRPRRDGTRPRAWAWTLALQALLSYVLFPVLGWRALVLGAFLAGSVLLLLPGWWAWASFVAILASLGALNATGPIPKVTGPIYATALTAAVGLMVYGLSRLADLAVHLAAVRGELAQMAVLRERLRVARDVHDLLGLGLSAIALKTDLIVQLFGRDEGRAREEIEELVRICATARADMRLVTDEARQLSLDAELATARDVLATAGIDVRAGSAHEPIPVDVDVVLATVLREAVTNILRHSSARHCTIRTSADDGSVRLSVSNDGATDPREREPREGRGLANLTARTEASGGRFTARRIDDRFEVVAEIPLPLPTVSRLRVSQLRLRRLPRRRLRGPVAGR
jgi:two-component system sensor histidine kinase DesK